MPTAPSARTIIGIVFLESSNGKILLEEVSDFDCLFNLSRSKIRIFGMMDFSFDCLYKTAVQYQFSKV